MTYVIDGDTVIVRMDDGERVHVRLIGIDTPEVSHSGGAERVLRRARGAADAAASRSAGEVALEPGRERHDRYGRLLAYVGVRRRAGRSRARRCSPAAPRARSRSRPNTDRAAAYAELERAARRAGRGLWGACPGR